LISTGDREIVVLFPVLIIINFKSVAIIAMAPRSLFS
jgi:hypothetical protein